jgi:DNA-binding transcriptional LysR family regulator
VLRGLGITILPRDIVQEDLNAGTLVAAVTGFPRAPAVAESASPARRCTAASCARCSRF